MPRTRQQTGAVAPRCYAESEYDEVDRNIDDGEMISYHPGRDDDGREATDEAEGFKLWTTTSKVTSGKLLDAASQWNTKARKFAQVVEVQHTAEFKLKPIILTEGTFKGRHVLMLEPVEPTEYFRFLDLPPELRTMIYDLVLLNTKNTVNIDAYKPKGLTRRPVQMGYQYHGGPGPWDKTTGKWSEQTPSNASLLRVNKQLFQETAPVLYGCHTFRFDSVMASEVFLEAIGTMRKHLRQVKFILTWRTTAYVKKRAQNVFNMLKDAQDLQSIKLSHELACRTSTRWNRWPGLERVVADCAALLWAVHKKKKNEEDSDTRVDAVDLLQLEDPERCWICKGRTDVDCRAPCNVKCDELGPHHEEVESKLQELVKAKLQLVGSTKKE